MRQKEKRALVHWYYSDREWQEFARLEKNRLRFFITQVLFKWAKRRANQVLVDESAVIVNGRATFFQANDVKLCRVDIIEVNRINMLELIYEKRNGRTRRAGELRVPIPKGKLLEAIKLLDCLNLQNGLLTIN